MKYTQVFEDSTQKNTAVMNKTLPPYNVHYIKDGAVYYGSPNIIKGTTTAANKYVYVRNGTEDLSYTNLYSITSDANSKFSIADEDNKITDFRMIFYNNTYLKTLDLSRFKFEGYLANGANTAMTDYTAAFSTCSNLESIKFPNLEPCSVYLQNMTGMFFACSKLTEVDLSIFNMMDAPSLSTVFKDCTSLKKIVFLSKIGDSATEFS